MPGPLVALIGLGIGFGLAAREQDIVERALARDVHSKLSGDSRRVEVETQPDGLGAAFGLLRSATIRASEFTVEALPLFVEPERSKKGRIGKLILELQDFRLRGLMVKSLRSEIPGCRFDFAAALSRESFRLSRSGVGTGVVKVAEADLAEFIVRKFPEIKRATVKIDKGFAWVEGYGEFLVVSTEFAVIARLRPIDGTKLELAEAKVYLDWRRAEPAAAQVLLDTLNPVVDLNADLGLFDALKIEGVKLDKGVIEAWGKTKIPERPSALDSR
ncbi:MAG: hypothetical protein KF884_01440 [Fimbriimonadaceae bacterium]|nr:hypothetical protein [Fimbriimonadaceae bacterium]QYK58758.1 MAG: hypothetical protein KF884_01440 [Fimbriimonadaceae bacterium]